LAKYYQATDYYLFSTLCHEGHPLSLTEALKCGSKCLASNIDPISEVLHKGNLGLLVDYPNYVDSWVNSINYALNNDVDFNKENLDLLKLYDFNQWSEEIKLIFNE
jgi:glycosyltransferase involved in cell wall biosynthesis